MHVVCSCAHAYSRQQRADSRQPVNACKLDSRSFKRPSMWLQVVPDMDELLELLREQ